MKFVHAFATVGFLVTGVAVAGEFKLPKEVTPAIRSACESDVRRLCIGKKATVAGVKECVFSKFNDLGRRCQVVLIAAGFSP